MRTITTILTLAIVLFSAAVSAQVVATQFGEQWMQLSNGTTTVEVAYVDGVISSLTQSSVSGVESVYSEFSGNAAEYHLTLANAAFNLATVEVLTGDESFEGLRGMFILKGATITLPSGDVETLPSIDAAQFIFNGYKTAYSIK